MSQKSNPADLNNWKDWTLRLVTGKQLATTVLERAEDLELLAETKKNQILKWVYDESLKDCTGKQLEQPGA